MWSDADRSTSGVRFSPGYFLMILVLEELHWSRIYLEVIRICPYNHHSTIAPHSRTTMVLFENNVSQFLNGRSTTRQQCKSLQKIVSTCGTQNLNTTDKSIKQLAKMHYRKFCMS